MKKSPEAVARESSAVIFKNIFPFVCVVLAPEL
jgi:hypothetical protein